jgi:hypothetical protein
LNRREEEARALAEAYTRKRRFAGEEIGFFMSMIDKILADLRERNLWPAEGASPEPIDGRYATGSDIVATARGIAYRLRKVGEEDGL